MGRFSICSYCRSYKRILSSSVEREGSETKTFLTIRRPMNAVGSPGSYTGIREHPLERLGKCEQIRP